MDPADLFHAETESRSGRNRFLIGKVILFAVAFALATVALYTLRGSLPHRELYIEIISDKLDHLDAHADDYDIVFFGTSHLYRNLNPAMVDDELTSAGLNWRSLNLAIPGMNVLEAEMILDRLEKLAPARLKYVVMEPFFRPLELKNWGTERAMSLHDWPRTTFAMDYVMETSSDSPRVRLAGFNEARAHLMSFIGPKLNLGRVARVLFPDTRHIRQPSFMAPDFDRGGFRPLDEEPASQFLRRYEGFLSQRDRNEQLLAASSADIWRRGRLSDLRTRHLLEVVERIRELGATPVFLVGPAYCFDLEIAAYLTRRDETFQDVKLLNYLHGFGFEDVYELEYWFDNKHLNSTGADLFSRQVGRDLAPLIQAGRDGVQSEQPEAPAEQHGTQPQQQG